MPARARFLAALGLLLAAWSRTAGAQDRVTSDLWRVAAGTFATPAALGSDGSAPLWTPAAALGAADPALKVGVETIHAPTEVGVAGSVATAMVRTGGGWTLHAAYGRISLSDLVRTETSPEAIGSISAFSQVLSVGLARALGDRSLSVGAALRMLTDRLDDRTSTRWAADVGVIFERPRLRLGAATHFLDGDLGRGVSGASLGLGAEYRTPTFSLGTAPATVLVRYGASWPPGERAAHLVSCGLALSGVFEVDAGAAREETSGTAVWRSRFGGAVTAGRYRVYVGRDGGVNGFGATYRFGLAATIQ